MNTSLLALIAISLLGGSLPLFVRWTHRQLHAVLAMSTGIFLGAVFLHLLPSISVLAEDFGQERAHASAQEASDDHAGHDHDSHEGHDHGDDHAGHDHGPSEGAAEGAAHQDHDHGDHDHEGHDHTGHEDPAEADAHAGHDHGAEGDGHGHHGHVHAPNTLWFFVLLGVIGVYLIEGLLLRTHDHGDLHRHRSVGYATLLGVTVHALTAGFGLGAVSNDAFQFDLFLVAILGHKGFEAFSLTTVFQLAEFPRKRVIALVVAFSLVTPLGMLLGARITGDLGGDGIAIATALAAGTFLYVCLSELLPEVFHKREDVLTKLVLLAIGVGLMSFFEGLVG